ncbi:UNVERIFIED_CONTAM: Phosphoinositide phosphatase SAC4 [Sesamum radiatum]|uniref:Phosphoinositide phosphatase SAC4 n=1 Tax=Sesamum radiatum TaxID=300843 RepID=A0AAW2R346_SESRA
MVCSLVPALVIRYTSSMPARELFAEIQQRDLEHENGDVIDCSNFVDLDWLSSSGNSCEEELLERTLLTVSPTAMLSSENVINELVGETTPSTSECGSSMREMENTGADTYYGEIRNYEVLEDFSDSFVRWFKGDVVNEEKDKCTDILVLKSCGALPSYSAMWFDRGNLDRTLIT